MTKEQDFQKLKKIVKLLSEIFITLYDIEDPEEIFNSPQAIEVLENYSSITTSLDELLYDLVAYFGELAVIHNEESTYSINESRVNRAPTERLLDDVEAIVGRDYYKDVATGEQSLFAQEAIYGTGMIVDYLQAITGVIEDREANVTEVDKSYFKEKTEGLVKMSNFLNRRLQEILSEIDFSQRRRKERGK